MLLNFPIKTSFRQQAGLIPIDIGLRAHDVRRGHIAYCAVMLYWIARGITTAPAASSTSRAISAA